MFSVNRVIKGVMIIIWLFTDYYMLAQEKYRINYNSSHGLSCNKIYVLRQDSKGFIWIATDNGLYRYDGLQFKRFSSSNGLPSNEVVEFDFGFNEDVWASCFNKNLALIRNNKVLTSKNYSPLSSFNNLKSFPRVVSFPNPRLITIGTRLNHYNFIDKYDSVFNSLSDEISVINKEDTLIYNHTKGELYFSSNKQNKAILPKFNHLPKISILSGKKFLLSANNQYSILISKVNQNLSISCLDSTVNYRHTQLPRNSNRIWGLKDKKTIICVDLNLNIIDSVNLPNTEVNCVLEDHSGGLWIGTYGSALYYIPNKSVYTYDMTHKLGSNHIVNTTQNGDTLYCLYSNGAVQKLTKQNPFPITIYNGLTLSEGQNYTTFAVIDNKIVLSNSSSNLHEVEAYSKKTKLKSEKFAGKMFKSDGQIMIHMACGTSFVIYDSRSRRNISLPIPAYSSHRINKDSILVGGVNGLSYLRVPVLNTIDSILIPYRIDTLKNTMITDINNINDKIYIATNEWGVLIKNGTKYDTINTKSGLNDNNCISLAKDHYNRMWVATYQGVYCILEESPSKYLVKPLSLTNSLFSANITKINCLGDFLYISTSKGLIRSLVTPPSEDSENMPIWISELINLNTELDPTATFIRLNPRLNNLTITLSAIHFSSLGPKKYYYRIPGLVEKFTAINSNILTLDRLPHGLHTLIVKAVSADGTHSSEISLLKIQVPPLWYQQLGGKVLLVMLSLLGILFLFQFIRQYRNRKLKREIELNNQLTELELKAIKAQINPHFIFNTLNLIQYFIQNNMNDQADDSLDKMSKLIRSTLNYSNEVSIALIDEIDYLTNYISLESLRFDNSFKFTIDKNFPEELNKMQIPTMVLQPYVENAIRHGLKPKINMKKNLTLSFYIKGNYLNCEVKDDGIGRQKSNKLNKKGVQLQTSHGEKLSLTKIKLFRKITGKETSVKIEDLVLNNQACGTLVTLEIEL